VQPLAQRPARRAVSLVAALAALAVAGCRSDCSSCEGSCNRGIQTQCLILDPPGCGAQTSFMFCPGGCVGGACSVSLPDGSLGNCVASSLVTSQGSLAAGASSVAVSALLSTNWELTFASSAALACAATRDGGLAASSGTGSVLTMPLPTGFGGTVSAAGAVLTLLDGGATPDVEAATGGSLELNLSQPGGGLLGSYDLFFGADEEKGNFLAPQCDVCATPP
jgi:hypothetical protein